MRSWPSATCGCSRTRRSTYRAAWPTPGTDEIASSAGVPPHARDAELACPGRRTARRSLVPLTGRAVPATTRSFVGRARERMLVRHLLADAQRGRACVLVISGVPGSGKTAFLHWIGEQPARCCLHVLSAVGEPPEEARGSDLVARQPDRSQEVAGDRALRVAPGAGPRTGRVVGRRPLTPCRHSWVSRGRHRAGARVGPTGVGPADPARRRRPRSC